MIKAQINIIRVVYPPQLCKWKSCCEYVIKSTKNYKQCKSKYCCKCAIIYSKFETMEILLQKCNMQKC